MAELNKLVLPVKNTSTGVITNQEFDLPSGGGSSKADKVTGATSGNFAGLDANGNLTDSGKKASDFLTQHQDISGKMDKANPTGTGSFSLNRGSGTTVGNNSFAEGYNTAASGEASHAEGNSTTASGSTSHAEGYATTASSSYSHAEGCWTGASTNVGAHAEGYYTSASGEGSHAEGRGYSSAYKVIATGKGAHAEGGAGSSKNLTASGTASHAEGYATTASGERSHAEGDGATASGTDSHAEGTMTTASGSYSHAEGYYGIASGLASHVGGDASNIYRPEVYRRAQFVQWGGKKFVDTLLADFTYPHGAAFSFSPDGTNYSSDTTISATQGEHGLSGTITNTATITISLGSQGIGSLYLLICSSWTLSSGAVYGATARLITCHGTATGTPNNLSLGQTSNAPATIGLAANNVITIKNSAAGRVTAFHLIQIY